MQLRLVPGNADIEVDDVRLQDATMCVQITRLDLSSFETVSPMGLLSLYQHFPGLAHVKCRWCPQLDDSARQMCMRLLQRHGSAVKIEGVV